MIRALLRIRFLSFLTGFVVQGKKQTKTSRKATTGKVLLFTVLWIYVLGVAGFLMYFLFDSLALPYHALGLDWLYFAMAGTFALGFSLLGGVFSTQNQLYNARDNDLLMAMPIPPRLILITRILPLLALNLLTSALVILPATLVYGLRIGFFWESVLFPVLSIVLISLLAQGLACLLGWGMHMLLQRMNKSFASLLFMVLFLGLYFYVYPQASKILQAMAANGQKLAETLQGWVWPLYALGAGCTGSPLLLAAAAICIGVFLIAWWFLSASFLKNAGRSAHSTRRKMYTHKKLRKPVQAVTAKELGKFLNTPVYLTNMGMGLVMCAALPIAALIFRKDLLSLRDAISPLADYIPLAICAIFAFTASMSVISTPSVSLEGKNLWILKSMPIAPRQILLGKLRLHLLLTLPLNGISALCLGLILDCEPVALLLMLLFCLGLSSTSGLLGMVAGLKWAKLEYLNEVYPCKQSTAVVISIFALMGLPVVLGLLYYFLLPNLSPLAFLTLCLTILAALCAVLWHLLMGWGIKKWESL